MMGSSDPNVQRLLNITGKFGSFIGVSNDRACNMITQVGNYGESYNRNLGPDTSCPLAGDANPSRANGGLLHAPPIR